MIPLLVQRLLLSDQSLRFLLLFHLECCWGTFEVFEGLISEDNGFFDNGCEESLIVTDNEEGASFFVEEVFEPVHDESAQLNVESRKSQRNLPNRCLKVEEIGAFVE